ncbi:MAG: DUF4381 domain-containing protein [Gammaproteobacteria bacterium]|nr:MAG: DUF4381 domain-containing protein [Gammaproteobacteria bacterium]
MADPATLPLRDIHLPPPVSWWPPAPGWWIVAALLCAALVWGIWQWRRLRRRQRWLREALAELERLEEAWKIDHDDHALLAGTTALLRRVQLHLGRRHDATLNGTAWIESLARVAEPPERLRALLVEGVYRPQLSLDAQEAEELVSFARQWIRAAAGGKGS